MINNKRALYHYIEDKKACLEINEDWYPLNTADIIDLMPNLDLHHQKLSSINIGAMLIKDKISGIFVNDSKPVCDQNFDIAHELIHFWLDPAESYFSFETLGKNQKTEIEIIANE